MKGDKEWACFSCKQKSVHSKLTEANHMNFLLQFFLFIFWVNKEKHKRWRRITLYSKSTKRKSICTWTRQWKCVFNRAFHWRISVCKLNSISYHLTLYFVFNIYFVDWHDEYDMGRKWMKRNFFVFCILIFCNGKHAAKQHEDRSVITFLTDDEVLHCNYLAHAHINI